MGMDTGTGFAHSQVGDARLAHSSGDGLDGGAEGVEELRELPGALRPPALLHHEAGHGDDIGVEGRAVRHPADTAALPPLPRCPQHQHRPRGGRGRAGSSCAPAHLCIRPRPLPWYIHNSLRHAICVFWGG